MGGAVDNKWDLDISQPAILIGTQDQILSRQLNRGYCLSRAKYPIHFAALNNDCRIAVDETQLQGIGYRTAVKLQHLRQEIGCYGNTQLILCSATLDSQPLDELEIDAPTYSVGKADYQHPYLGQKLTKSKKLYKAKTFWVGNSNNIFIDSLRSEVINLHRGGLTLIVLNRVDSAQKLYSSLFDSGLPLRLLHGRYRKADRQVLVEDLTEFKGIIVSTQCIEAGIDLDARVLITELCPWSSFVQRCGRAGRKDMTEDISVYWIDHRSIDKEYSCKPYTPKELKAAQAIIKTLDDVCIKNLVEITPPKQEIKGEHLQKNRLRELFDSHPVSEDIDVSCYIRNAIDNNVFIGWREFEGNPSNDWRLHDSEICSVPISKVRAFKGRGWQFNSSDETWNQIALNAAKVGDLILLPCSAGGYSAAKGWTGNKNDIPHQISVEDLSNREVKSKTSFCSTSISLTQHSIDAAYEMKEIIERLGVTVPEELKPFLIDIAQWHDAGKAHPIFQTTLGGNKTNILAKSSTGGRHSRKGFRHELASALMALAARKPFLFAYLVCCHHGKVRTNITPSNWDRDSPNQYLSFGVQEGDEIYPADLGEPIELLDQQNISFEVIPGTESKPWLRWKSECKKLLRHEEMGEFRLAYLETLVRCADAVASSKY